MTYISESVFQYACKANYNTETALVKVQNEVLRALNGQQSVILLLLDLYAPFDTMDHAILPTRLSQRFLIKVLFSSYLSERKQFVSVNGTTSSHRDLPYGIPQGSFLGSMLFLMYTAPLADVIRKHDMWFHLYAG